VTARRTTVGTTVKGWAERHLDAETLDALVLPAIADLQYEDSMSKGRPALVRWVIRLRGYVALGEAFGAHLLSRRARSTKAPAFAVPRAASSSGGRGGIMTESNRNLLMMTGAGALVAAVAFVAGRASAPEPVIRPAWQTATVASAGTPVDYRALQRSIDEQRREAAERDRKFQQQLDQQRYDAERDREKAERTRIDAETELAWQRTQQVLDQQRRDAEAERAKVERARSDAEAQLVRLRMQQMLDELSRKQ
jgi:hypothetical protein